MHNRAVSLKTATRISRLALGLSRAHISKLTGESYAAKVLALGPIAYWRLNETGGVNVADSSGNGYDATATGVTWQDDPGPNGDGAPLFDGANDFIAFPAGFLAAYDGAEGACLLWIKAFNAGTWLEAAKRYAIQARSDGANFGRVLKLDAPTDTLRIRELTGGGVGNDETTQSRVDFFSVSFSWSEVEGFVRWMVGGVSSPSDAIGGVWGGPPLDGVNSAIGSRRTALGGADHWHGWISDVAFWDGPLSDEVMATLHETGG